MSDRIRVSSAKMADAGFKKIETGKFKDGIALKPVESFAVTAPKELGAIGGGIAVLLELRRTPGRQSPESYQVALDRRQATALAESLLRALSD